MAPSEALERPLALHLRLIGMDGVRAEACTLQLAGAYLGARLRVGEHDDALAAALLEHEAQQLGLLHRADGDHELVDGVGGLAFVGHLDERGILQDGGHALHDLAVERCREQQRLARRGRGGHDLLHGRPETHVQHAVGLVQHEHLHVAQLDDAAFHEVVQPAGRGHEDVDAAVELRDLPLVLRAAHHGEHAAVRRFRQLRASGVDLLGQLARGAHDERPRRSRALGAADALEQGQRERGRLAGAGGRGGHDIATFEDQRDRLLLHGGGGGEAHPLDGGKGRLGQAEVLKRRTQSVSPSIVAGFARRAAPAARIACGADVGAHRSPASMIAYHARLREVPREYPVTRGIADATGRGGVRLGLLVFEGMRVFLAHARFCQPK